MMETQRSITEWAEQTFGPSHPAVIASRMNVEVAELVSGLSTVARLEVSDIDPNTLDALREECADVGVMLFQVCEKLGVDLQTAINYKMAVNRSRSWAKTPSGHYQHVETFLEPGTGLTMDLDKFYIISDSGSSFTPVGFSSVEEATRWAQASASTFGDLEVTVPKFKGASEGWDEMGSCNVVAARDLLEFWKANPLSQGEPA